MLQLIIYRHQGRFYSFRPQNFNSGKKRFFAFASWLFVGHGVALLVGTTSIASVYLLIANSLQIQESVAHRIGKYLSKSTGLEVSFSSAIVPNWRSGRIVFQDVLVQRPPPGPDIQPGSSQDNYTRFRLSIERVETTISLWRWLCGRGLVESANVHGVRGVVDRSALFPAPGWKHAARWGDFDIEQAQVKDVLVSVVNGERAPSYALSVYQARIPRVRKSWLIYDLLRADSVLGLFDNSLFSYQMPQRHDANWHADLSHLRHLKIDNVRSQHYTGLRAPLWKMITKGTVDLDVFIRLDQKEAEKEASQGSHSERLKSILISIFEDSLKESPIVVNSLPEELHPWESPWRYVKNVLHPPTNSPSSTDKAPLEDGRVEGVAASYFLNTPNHHMAFKACLTLRNIKASPNDAPFWMRPVAAYLNESQPFIRVNCNFSLPRQDFDGAWSVHECGLSSALAEAVWQTLDQAANDKTRQLGRLKKVGLWSLYSLLKQVTEASDSSSSASSSPSSSSTSSSNYSNSNLMMLFT